MSQIITAADIADAAETIRGVAVRTPLLEFMPLNAAVKRRVLVKFEGAQHTGSFKFRGAYNRLSRIEETRRGAGVVAWSSGNHAQGVAAAARMLKMRATIVMPSDAPAVKLANTRALGAEIVSYDRQSESREEIATAIARNRGAVLVPSFDDPFIMAGQGTVGLEIMQQSREIGLDIESVLVCCGGGGLVSGVATAVKDLDSGVSIYSVEPEGFDDTARSLVTGKRESVKTGFQSICDALLAPMPGEITFPVNRHLLSGGLVVSDAQVKEAMRFAFEKLKLVVEPGGAVALAAALNGLAPVSEGPLAIVVSGSNVDPEMYAAIIAQAI
ncbi:threonine ammonia-lyase [Neorhizobium alkalisoli]|uniref:Threonine dehydratase n=1 Tax=Neorhizobium alkalisoli TaxID=528178 RepID=A0A561Q0H5_9HYPH|nr:threonine/serine dehydratase [Neorhizobium alkalisoli]TWF43878.1 threonine dehydratase [Neorhizobium alkalisoli]